MSTKMWSNVCYIDEVTHASLVKQGVDPFNIDSKRLSPLTKELIEQCDAFIKKTIYNGEALCEATSDHISLSKEELEYAKSKIKNYLVAFDQNSCSDEKCYDITPFIANEQLTLLVIVKEGFLSTVTETKDALLEHLLNLLRHLYDHNTSDWFVRREYLNLRLNKGAFDLVKLRLDRV